MVVSRFPLLFLRRALNLQILVRQQQEIHLVKKRFYSVKVVPKVSSNALDLLITNLTEKNNVEGAEINTVTSIDGLSKICSKLEGPISGEISVRVLARFAELANENAGIQRAAVYLKKELLTEMDKSLKNEKLSMNSTLEAMCALVVLELTQESIFETLIDVLRQQFSTDLFSLPVSPLVRLAALVSNKKIRLPDDLFRQMREWLQLKASEITEPKDIISVMACWNKSNSWFNMFIEKAKSCVSSMSSDELIGMMASLAKSSSRPPHVLRLICNTFEQNKKDLTVNQLVLLAQSAAKLRFMDSRLRRIIAEETFANISHFTKWSQINMIVNSMAKLQIGYLPAWNAVAAWINNNQMNAAPAELSYAVHWCAIAGKGDLIKETSGYLCEKLTSRSVDLSKTWLSTVYALATCDRLSPELAQTVLQPSFVVNVLEGLSGFRKLMAVTTIAQVQHFLKAILDKSYNGPSVDILDLMQFSSATVNDMTLKLRYGKSEEGNVQYFHSLLHKLVPVNSHAFPPALNEDGIFVNAVIKLDVKGNRFVPLSHFEETKVPRLAVIYLSWRDRTLPCGDDDKSTLMGPPLLNMRLLKARGFIPVLFSQDDFDSNTSLKQQFTRIKTKLEEASDERGSG
uniref:RAP domain-containing protein n=1 Tax=Onchocerca volvulus TaxID=6282 RepID=A0A8R1XX17_ONCVO